MTNATVSLLGQMSPKESHSDTSPQPQWTCDQCNEIFPTKEDSNRHFESLHQSENVYECCLCGFRFLRPSTLKTHQAIHHSAKETGSKQSPSREDPIATSKNGGSEDIGAREQDCRNKVPVEETGKLLICEICERNFSNAEALKTHTKKVHLEEEDSRPDVGLDQPNVQFEVSEEKADSPAKQVEHLREDSYSEVEQFDVGDDANSEYPDFKPLIIPEQFEVENGVEEEWAEIKNFILNQEKENPIPSPVATEESENKDFILRNEDENTFQTEELERQDDFILRDDSKEVPIEYYCGICDDGLEELFETVADLKRHYRKFHPRNMFCCHICRTELVYFEAVKAHMLSAHYKTKTWVCKVCKKGFIFRYQLRKHYRFVHLKERNYKCGKCEKLFARSHNLKSHMASVHLTKRNHKCRKCGKPFGRPLQLLRHWASVHNENVVTNIEEDAEITSKNEDNVSDIHVLNIPESDLAFQETDCGIDDKHLKLQGTSDKKQNENRRLMSGPNLGASEDDIKYYCGICDNGDESTKVFTRLLHLKRHYAKFHPKKNFRCHLPTCKRELKAFNSVKTHMLTHFLRNSTGVN